MKNDLAGLSREEMDVVAETLSDAVLVVSSQTPPEVMNRVNIYLVDSFTSKLMAMAFQPTQVAMIHEEVFDNLEVQQYLIKLTTVFHLRLGLDADHYNRLCLSTAWALDVLTSLGNPQNRVASEELLARSVGSPTIHDLLFSNKWMLVYVLLHLMMKLDTQEETVSNKSKPKKGAVSA